MLGFAFLLLGLLFLDLLFGLLLLVNEVRMCCGKERYDGKKYAMWFKRTAPWNRFPFG